jgi:hypothetical protein
MRRYPRLELGVPGILLGLLAGPAAGFMALVVGQPPSWALVAMLSLGLPLALSGAGYSLLLAGGHVRIGGFAPAALYWLFGFPLARLIQEVCTRLTVTGELGFPPGVLGFLAFQGIVSAGFAIGFLWLHERLAPRWWRRVADHNPAAQVIYERYAVHAHAIFSARELRRGREGSKSR